MFRGLSAIDEAMATHLRWLLIIPLGGWMMRNLMKPLLREKMMFFASLVILKHGKDAR